MGIYTIGSYMDGHNQKVVVEKEPAWCGMTVRKDWLEELNMEVPRTIHELYDVLVAFRDRYGAWMHLYKDGTIGNDYILSAFGVLQDFYLIDGGTEVGFGPMTHEYKEYLKLMQRWYAEGLIDPNFSSTSSTYDLTNHMYFADNLCGVGMSHKDTCGNYHYYHGYTDEEDIWLEPMEGPVWEKGDTTLSTCPTYEAYSPNLVFTAVGEEELPILAKFLDWHYTYDYAVIASFGIEGESYVIDEESDGYYVYTDTLKDQFTQSAKSGDLLEAYTLPDHVGYANWQSGFEGNEIKGLTGVERAYGVWGKQTDDLMIPAAANLTAEEWNTYQNLYEDIEIYVNTCAVQFITGELNLDQVWRSYQIALESMGINRCIEIRQASVDRFHQRIWQSDRWNQTFF